MCRWAAYLFWCGVCIAVRPVAFGDKAPQVLLSTFSADVTIPPGHRCMGVLPVKSRTVRDPLEARGFVLQPNGQLPIVFCAVDWCEIRNGAYDQWREALAVAARTTRKRVLICSIHQHDAPVADAGAAGILNSVGLANELYDVAFHNQAVARVAAAVQASLSQSVPVTEIGIGKARVDRIASNRRVELSDGRVTFGRGSRSATDSVFRDAPEGQIDPILRQLSFWNREKPVAVLSVYATHPMSRYGQGVVSADFVGDARRKFQQVAGPAFHIYASGCSGDVTAGKYNDGSEDSRRQLADRLYQAMQRAWDTTKRTPLDRVGFRSVPLVLDYYEHAGLEPARLKKTVQNSELSTETRILAAMGLSSYQRCTAGQPIDFCCVELGPARIVLFPGEAFVGYQLMAQQMAPDQFVIAVGYGECWPGYIPLNSSFADHFHDKWLWVAPGSHNKIERALQAVLIPKEHRPATHN